MALKAIVRPCTIGLLLNLLLEITIYYIIVTGVDNITYPHSCLHGDAA